jgi:hypothetical protein
MYYAEYNNSNEDEISKKLNKEFEIDYHEKYSNYNNSNDNIKPYYDNYYKPQSGFCDMSFGGLIQNNKTSTIVIPVNADLNYDIDCKMGYSTTLLVPITVPTITEKSPVIIIPIVTQQNINKNNNNIISTATQQPILEASLKDSKIHVKVIDNIKDINQNSKIVSSVTNLNETVEKVVATTITSLPVKPNDNKKVVTESNIINTDISGSNTKTNTNISISQTCLKGSLQCDVNQQIKNIKSDVSHNYNTYSESSRTIIDLSSGEISLFKKNITENITTIPTIFINKVVDISKNLDLSKNIVQLKNKLIDISKNLDLSKNIVQLNNKLIDISKNKLIDISKNKLIDISKNKLIDISKNNLIDISKNKLFDISKNKLIDISKNNLDISKNIILVNNNNSLKMSIPTSASTIIKLDISGQVMSTTSDAIKITTKNPSFISTIIERFTLNDMSGYSVTPINNSNEDDDDDDNETLPTINYPVVTI